MTRCNVILALLYALMQATNLLVIFAVTDFPEEKIYNIFPILFSAFHVTNPASC
jgi:hypothetical protein